MGTSYTYYHALPQMLAALAASATPPVTIDHASVTVGGSTLARLSEDPRVVEMLARDWDYVVLQDQSQIPGGARPRRGPRQARRRELDPRGPREASQEATVSPRVSPCEGMDISLDN